MTDSLFVALKQLFNFFLVKNYYFRLKTQAEVLLRSNIWFKLTEASEQHTADRRLIIL